MKTYSACKTRYDHPTTIHPADRRARNIRQDYSGKFKKLDSVFAADVVGGGSGDIIGPFERAQQGFHQQQIIPLCAGGFGEVNGDFVEVIKTLARSAAAGEVGLAVSPLANMDRKGGAYRILLQQFKRAVGVAIVRGQAMHKIGRLHYIRGTAAEAAAAAAAHHSSNRWRPGQNGRARWYSDHVPEGYGAFEQFRNGRTFGVY